eukprot:TRINITY_DN5187_c0_g1_i1.p1 TRINITY_DN5187_c0_g1~~TRINITY_DN5187_c0_g1_i1.p1  ORF type:complete len:392 (-),score=84.33 TRINITY_DN5187_c0_g1_i1:39-1172(-)
MDDANDASVRVPLVVNNGAAAAEPGIVPGYFRADCDKAFAELAQVHDGFAVPASVLASWDKDFGPDADRVSCLRALELCYRKGGAEPGVSPAGFALGSFLLATEVANFRGAPRVDPTPKQLSMAQYDASGFADAPFVRTLADVVQSRKIMRRMVIAMVVNLLIGVASCCYFMIMPLALVTLGISIYFVRFLKKYPFLLPRLKFTRSVQAFGILGVMGNISGSVSGWILLPYFGMQMAYSCAVFEITYVGLSTAACVHVLRAYRALQTRSLVNTRKVLNTNNNALLLTSWTMLTLGGLSSLAVFVACENNPRLREVCAYWLIGAAVACGIPCMSMFSTLVHRRHRLRKSVMGLALALSLLVAAPLFGIPFIMFPHRTT